MKLIFKSKLGHQVTHKVREIKRNLYETMTDSRLVIRISPTGVYLLGGHAAFSTRKIGWRRNFNTHWYNEPVLLGYGGELV